jgi:hypothetical protein
MAGMARCLKCASMSQAQRGLRRARRSRASNGVVCDLYWVGRELLRMPGLWYRKVGCALPPEGGWAFCLGNGVGGLGGHKRWAGHDLDFSQEERLGSRPGHHLERIARQETQLSTPSRGRRVQLMGQGTVGKYSYIKRRTLLTSSTTGSVISPNLTISKDEHGNII